MACTVGKEATAYRVSRNSFCSNGFTFQVFAQVPLKERRSSFLLSKRICLDNLDISEDDLLSFK